ncbi:type I-B CRISPR-associated protein Cas5b (plasmid) [Haloferacaceae archaeon DSL9]
MTQDAAPPSDADNALVADTRPALDRDLVREPEQCLSFTVCGSWGHFRRVEGTTVKQSYRVMPRTTVAGMLAAILGMERDSYYELFGPETSALAIEPRFDLRSINMPENTLSTNKTSSETHSGSAMKARLPNPEKNRQQHNYEFLADPRYRIDVWLADDDVYDELRMRLDERRYYYSPSLGLSECLATIRYHGEETIEPGMSSRVDSAIPADTTALIPAPGVEYASERSPGFMTAETDTEGGRSLRQTTGFLDWVFATGDPDEATLETTGLPTSKVGNRTVVFS